MTPTAHPRAGAREEVGAGQLASKLGTQTSQPPLIPAHAGIQLSQLRPIYSKDMDPRLRGDERLLDGPRPLVQAQP